jgi:hypothetical protein
MLVRLIGTLIGAAMIALVLLDTFETIVQPRRVTHRFRFARLFYIWNWRMCCFIALRIPPGKRREAFLSFFGPLSLLALFAAWVIGLIFGFAILNFSIPTAVQEGGLTIHFPGYLYLSGTTFFTLGYGDITPVDHVGRVLAIVESGMGFTFLGVIVSYLPGINQAFSRREVTISLLDARAGSPPSAAQLLIRLGRLGSVEQVEDFLKEWESWSAELLESHLSFPVLSYFRSQHDNQSWLAALTCMLDTCALLLSKVEGINRYRAKLTFAMARHAAVDLSLIFKAAPLAPEINRLSPELEKQMEQALVAAGVKLHDDGEGVANLNELRGMYEPFVNALAQRLLLTLPGVFTEGDPVDNWQRSPGSRAPGINRLANIDSAADHFAS